MELCVARNTADVRWLFVQRLLFWSNALAWGLSVPLCNGKFILYSNQHRLVKLKSISEIKIDLWNDTEFFHIARILHVIGQNPAPRLKGIDKSFYLQFVCINLQPKYFDSIGLPHVVGSASMSPSGSRVTGDIEWKWAGCVCVDDNCLATTLFLHMSNLSVNAIIRNETKRNHKW